MNVEKDYGLVSIIMPNYNSEKFVEQSIQSVIDQSYGNWELIIVDDCSSDNSVNLIKKFSDPRIKLIQNQENCGAALSRNNAIEVSNGRWIAFLDSDDLWERDKLQIQLSFMSEKNSVFSCSAYQVIDENGNVVSNYDVKKNEFFYKDILKHCSVGCLTAVYDKEKLGKILMPVEAEKREDFACWLKILKNGEKVDFLHQSLGRYRKSTGSVSANKFKMIKYQWRVYRKVEKINFFSSLYYLVCWAFAGLRKYK